MVKKQFNEQSVLEQNRRRTIMTNNQNPQEKWDPKVVAEQIKDNFTPQSTVRSIATHLIVNKPWCDELTHDQIADVVVYVKHLFGQQAKTTGSSIAWYKQDMKKKGNHEELRSTFAAHLQTLAPDEREQILIDLAKKNIIDLVKAADVEDLEQYIPVEDKPEKKPSEAQVAAARRNKGKAKETEPKKNEEPAEVAPLTKGGKSAKAK